MPMQVAAAAGAAPPPPLYAAPPPSALPHLPFVAPGQVAMPVQAPAKKSGMIWLVVLVLAAAGYYYYDHYMKPMGQGNPPPQGQAPQGQAPVPAGQPGPQGQQPGPQAQQPGPQAQPGPQGQQPGPQGQQPGPQAQQPGPQGQQPGGPQGGPGAGPQAQPGGPQGPGTNNQALVQEQEFDWKGQPQNGYVEITQSEWKNNSNVTMQSATLLCAQLTAQNQVMATNQVTLNGPLPPGQAMTFPAFQIGQLAQGVSNVKCAIVAVTPATQ
jgi:hypothetical protein